MRTPLLCLTMLLSGITIMGESLKNADIAVMVQAKVPQDVIIQKIANCEQQQFQLFPEDMAAMARAGISDDIIRAMAARQNGGLPLRGSVLASGPLKIYIQPSDGFESYIAAAFVKKRVPAVITTDSHSSSRYTLTSAVRSKDETGFGKWVRCAYVLCMGMEGFQTATVQLVNTNKEVVWAYNVRKGHSQNYQSSAEAIAKHIKKFLEMRPL